MKRIKLFLFVILTLALTLPVSGQMREIKTLLIIAEE